MATVAHTINPALPNHTLISWTALTSVNSDGDGVLLLGNGDRTVQAVGADFGSGTLAIQGSLDGTNWVTLQDLEGAALTFTAAGLKGILEAPPYIRPLLSGGSGGSVDVLVSVGKPS